MTRLLTTGCSFTFYKWKTWADFTAKDFHDSLNKGIPGADNATIARITVSMANPGDTVCVMWSSYLRHNYKIDFNDTYNWSQNHWGQENLKDKYYVANILNQYERFVTTLDYIELVHADSVNRKYKVIHLSAFPFLQGELGSSITIDMEQKLKEKQFYIDLIHYTDLYTFNLPYEDNTTNDPHPAEYVHELYANQIVKSLL